MPVKKVRLKPEVKDLTIRVCAGTGGLAAGSQDVMDGGKNRHTTDGIDDSLEGHRVHVQETADQQQREEEQLELQVGDLL